MKKHRVVLFITTLLVVGLSWQATTIRPTAHTVKAQGSPIQHIVIMDKENRTFDSLFGTFPGANGATTYQDKQGITHPLKHETLALPNDICHTYPCAKNAENGGKMNGFTSAGEVQFHSTDIPNYWKLAQTFGLADNNFSQIEGPTFGNHIYTIAGSDNNVDELPVLPNGSLAREWGCDSPTGTTVEERNAQNVVTKVYPCFGNTTIGDELTAAGVSWTYYAQTTKGASGYNFLTYDAFKQIRDTSQWATHIKPYSQFAIDAAAGNLPQVSWLTTTLALSDHPPYSICPAENWTVQQFNALMHGPDWATSATVLTWDDWGGFYDHVLPPRTGAANAVIELGMRTPMLMVSPFARQGVDHTQFSTVSILKFIENTFGVPAITSEDGSATGFDEMLNFAQTPLAAPALSTRTCPATRTPTSGAVLTPDD